MLIALAIACQFGSPNDPQIAKLRQYYRYPPPQVIESLGETFAQPGQSKTAEARRMKVWTVFYNRENFKEVTTVWDTKSKRFEMARVYWAERGIPKLYELAAWHPEGSPTLLNRLLLQDQNRAADAWNTSAFRGSNRITVAADGRLLAEREVSVGLPTDGSRIRTLRHRFIRTPDVSETRFKATEGAFLQTLPSVVERQQLKRFYESPKPVSFITRTTLRSRELHSPEKVETAVYRTIFVDRNNYWVDLIEHTNVADLPRRVGWLIDGKGSPLKSPQDERWLFPQNNLTVLHGLLLGDFYWLALGESGAWPRFDMGVRGSQLEIERDSSGRIRSEKEGVADMTGHVQRWWFSRNVTHEYESAPPTLKDLIIKS